MRLLEMDERFRAAVRREFARPVPKRPVGSWSQLEEFRKARRENRMGNEFDDFIQRMKEEDSASFDMDAKGRAVHIIGDAIQRMRNEGLGSIDIAKSLSHAAAVLAGHEDDWEWEWEDE